LQNGTEKDRIVSAFALDNIHMLHCICCGAGNVRLSRQKWVWEVLRQQFTQSCLYRCDRCGWRGWGPAVPHGMKEVAAPNGVVVPNSPEEFIEPVLAAAPTGPDDLDFHLLNIPPKAGRELR